MYNMAGGETGTIGPNEGYAAWYTLALELEE